MKDAVVPIADHKKEITKKLHLHVLQNILSCVRIKYQLGFTVYLFYRTITSNPAIHKEAFVKNSIPKMVYFVVLKARRLINCLSLYQW